MLLAVADWALYSLLLRRWAKYLMPIPALALLGVLMLLGVPLILPFYLYELSQGARFVVTPSNLGAIAYTAVFASLVAYLAWNHGVRVLCAARARPASSNRTSSPAEGARLRCRADGSAAEAQGPVSRAWRSPPMAVEKMEAA